jgi:hypothetical protein
METIGEDSVGGGEGDDSLLLEGNEIYYEDSSMVEDDMADDSSISKRRKQQSHGITSDSKIGEEGEKKEKKKSKKKKKKKKSGASESEMESDAEDGKKKKRRKKKKKSKQKTQSHDESSRSDLQSGQQSGTDGGGGGPKIEKRRVRRLGKKMDPEEWTREELMERVSRFGSYEVDRSNGSGKLTVEHRRILDDEMKILMELFRRNTEIQTLTFRKCFLTDEILEELMTKGFSGLRHVRILNFTSNGLTRKTTQLIIDTYQRALRPLKSIDLRENLINEEDSRQLYNAFSATLTFLNGIDLTSFKDHKDNKAFLCQDLKAHRIETGVICCVLDAHLSLDALDASRNFIDSNCLILLSKVLLPLTNIHKVVLNYNPLTSSIGSESTDNSSSSLDLRGITEFMKMLRINQWIVDVEMIGCKVPPKMQENIERSLMVNRSIEGLLRGMVI